MEEKSLQEELSRSLEELEKRLVEFRTNLKAGELSLEDAVLILNEMLKVLEPSGEAGLPLPIRRELTALTDVMEREKAELARLIRDTGNILADTAIEIATLLKLVKDLPPEIAEGLQSLKDSLDKEVGKLKRTLAWLQPLGDFARMGLKAGLEYFVERSFAGLPVRIILNLQGTPDKLPGVMASALFRILQGALFYSYHYAEARNIEVNFQQEPGILIFTVTNDGAPFDETKPEVLSSLIVIQEQARWLGGELKFYSSKKGINKLVIRIPFVL